MRFLATIAFLLLCVSPVVAEPTVTKQVEYYDVKGWDAAFIHNEMDAKGPNDRNSGRRVWAHTRWYVNWTFNTVEESLSCRVASVDTTVKIEFVVPRWVERDKAPESVRDKWDQFYAALQKHEQQHAMHGVQAARDIEAQIPQLKATRNCKQAREQARTAAKDIIGTYASMDIELDSRTDHGRTEGVSF